MITKISNLTMGRQSGVNYGFQPVVETIQYARVGENITQTGIALAHERLHAFAFVSWFL